MRSRRTTTLAIACIASLLAAWPAAATAGSLLSGYGGPGQGSQVILGGSLVNGPPKGGGGPPGGGSQGGGGSQETGGSSTAGRGSVAARSGSAGGTPTGSVAHRHSAAAGRQGAHATVRITGASSGRSRSYPAAEDAASRSAGVGSETLGLSGMDLLFILLALGALVLTGVVTRRMARTSAAGGTGS